MTFYLIETQLPVWEQLKLEEALLRADGRNFCLINRGSLPAIVLGISGKVEELVDLKRAKSSGIPLVRRFSGGGTVVVDEETLFVTFISQKGLHLFPCYPEPILKWSEEFYKEALGLDQFHLRENDYVIGEKKCGGNAQYLKKDRWLHHTTFLWKYEQERMRHLLHPKKTPQYRAGRDHFDFLCQLHEHLASKDLFVEKIKETLSLRYTVHPMSLEEAHKVALIPHRKATTFCDLVD